ncbi:type II toxin-antitoxin system prevent-host-death family antitoxin [Nonomuraea sp. NPDC050227]|uniref:type II toxin-antitoxin system prevent-host-death family antitoxin n=1 Tax=Nonomuraea sp. NPDC050227 TaxID=3364360 RepID=UPI0037B4CD20
MSENEIGLREGRAKFGDLVNRAEYAGQITYITRHGRRVAAIVPIDLIPQESTVTTYTLISATSGDRMPEGATELAESTITWHDLPADAQTWATEQGYGDSDDELLYVIEGEAEVAGWPTRIVTMAPRTITFTRENDKPDWGTDTITITVNGNEVTEDFTVDGISDKDIRSFSDPGEVESYLHNRRVDLTSEGYREQ